MEYSPFISQNSKGVFHYPSCSWQPVVMYTFKMINFCWDVAIAHALIRQTAHHPQAQMAWIIRMHYWAEPWCLEYSVHCSPVIFQMSNVWTHWNHLTNCRLELLLILNNILHLPQHEDHWEIVIVIEKLISSLIWLPHPNMLSILTSYVVRKICSPVEFICWAYPIIFVSSWHIGWFHTFPYHVTGYSNTFTYSSSAEKVLIM